jgi:hypothetical protein
MNYRLRRATGIGGHVLITGFEDCHPSFGLPEPKCRTPVV